MLCIVYFICLGCSYQLKHIYIPIPIFMPDNKQNTRVEYTMTKNKCGQKRQIDYDAVLDYAAQHPMLSQDALAAHFGTTQSSICKVLRKAGLHRVRGRKPSGSYWEQKLHAEGLGMDTGLYIGGKQIFYGQDYDRV